MILTPLFIAKTALLGTMAGLLGGLFGIGGGMFLVPALVFFMGLGQREAQGISLAVIAPMAIFSYLRYRSIGSVTLDNKIIIVLAIAAIIGGQFGAIAASSISNRNLQIGFGAFVTIFGIFMVVKGIRS